MLKTEVKEKADWSSSDLVVFGLLPAELSAEDDVEADDLNTEYTESIDEEETDTKVWEQPSAVIVHLAYTDKSCRINIMHNVLFLIIWSELLIHLLLRVYRVLKVQRRICPTACCLKVRG